MKNPKKPTRSQKMLIASKRLNPRNWLVISDTETQLTVYNKLKGTKRVINK